MENLSPTHREVHMTKQSNNVVEGLTKDVWELIKTNITHGNSKLIERTACQTTLVIAIEDFRKKYILKKSQLANINGEIQQTETDFFTEAVAGLDGKNSALATEVQKLTETNAHKVKEAQNMKKQRTLQTNTNAESPKKLTDYLDGTKANSLAVAILKQNQQPLNEFTQTYHREITTLLNSSREQINNLSAAFDIEENITNAVENEQETEFVCEIADEFQKRKDT